MSSLPPSPSEVYLALDNTRSVLLLLLPHPFPARSLALDNNTYSVLPHFAVDNNMLCCPPSLPARCRPRSRSRTAASSCGGATATCSTGRRRPSPPASPGRAAAVSFYHVHVLLPAVQFPTRLRFISFILYWHVHALAHCAAVHCAVACANAKPNSRRLPPTACRWMLRVAGQDEAGNKNQRAVAFPSAGMQSAETDHEAAAAAAADLDVCTAGSETHPRAQAARGPTRCPQSGP